tara:strand:+ start:5815 stop:6288 length:474 start_codon:yes stop_codon:yes gene_type:complete
MIKKILILVFISQLLIACGFTPTYKVLENKKNINIHYEIEADSSYIARQVLSSHIQNIEKSKAEFITKIKIIEKESAVNVKSSGSVDEYKIDILVNFEMFDISSNVLLFKSQSRGFANYDVSNSEYTNSLVQKEALENALIEGIQLMDIIIQSKITE